MHVTYTADDGAVQRWEFNPLRVRSVEAELIEKRYGQPWDKFVADVQSGSMKARRILLWHLLKQEHHTLRYEDTPDFYAGDLAVEHTVTELNEIRERIEKAELPEAEREQVMAALDIAISDALARGEVAEGKAPSNAGA
jgi:hypothetical protein